mgnify:CR=1 FL=1
MDLVGDIARHYIHIPIVMGAVLVYGVLLYHVFFKPVRKVLDERQAKIAESGALSMKAQEESRDKLGIYEAKLSEARKEAARIREAIRAEVAEYQAGLLRDVRREVEEKASLRSAELEKSVEEAEKSLKKLIPELASGMAEKILKSGAA